MSKKFYFIYLHDVVAERRGESLPSFFSWGGIRSVACMLISALDVESQDVVQMKLSVKEDMFFFYIGIYCYMFSVFFSV